LVKHPTLWGVRQNTCRLRAAPSLRKRVGIRRVLTSPSFVKRGDRSQAVGVLPFTRRRWVFLRKKFSFSLSCTAP